MTVWKDADFGAPGSWGARALDACRVSAITAAVVAPVSTAATSIAVAVFVISLVASGAAPRIAWEAFRLPAGKGILAFFAIMIASAFLNPQGLRVAFADLWSWRKLAFLYLALPLFVADAWKGRLVANVFWGMVVMLAASYLSVAEILPTRQPGPPPVPGVVLTNYAVQGVAFAVATLFGAFLAQRAHGRRRWLYIALCVAFIVNVLFFGTGRTGYLAIVALIVLWGFLTRGWRGAAASVAGLAGLVALAFVVSPTFHSRLALAWEEYRHAESLRTENSIGIRVLFTQNTVALIRERPVLGYGLGSFKRVYADYVYARYTGMKATPAGDPHNQYLYVWFEHGAVGLIVFLGMIGSFFVMFPRDAFGRMATCVVVAWCLTSAFSSHFRTFPEGHFYAFVVAGLGATTGRRFTAGASTREGVNRAGPTQPAAGAKVLEYSSPEVERRPAP